MNYIKDQPLRTYYYVSCLDGSTDEVLATKCDAKDGCFIFSREMVYLHPIDEMYFTKTLEVQYIPMHFVKTVVVGEEEVRKELKKEDLRHGQEVYWHDPDAGCSSGYYEILEFFEDDVVSIQNEAGSYAEVHVSELSLGFK